MNEDNIYGFESTYSGETRGIQVGEIVDIIFLDKIFAGFNAFTKQEYERKVDNEKIGIPYEYREPTFKALGLCWKYAIISRSKEETNPDNFEKVFRSDDYGKPIEPNYICYGQINEYPPSFVYKNNFNFQRFGGSVEINKKTLKPVIIELLPSTFIEKDWNSKVRADQIPKGQEGKYISLVQRESARKQKWEKVISSFNALEEHQAYLALEKGLSRRLLNCYFKSEEVDHTATIQKYEYLPIKTGTVIRGIYRRPNKFTEVHTFERENGKLEIYSTLEAKEPDELHIQTAKDLIECREENKRKRAELKSNEEDDGPNKF